MSTECSICIQPSETVIQCQKCKYTSCEECLKRYFETISEPCCPSCTDVWSREFIVIHFKSFYSDFVKMRQKLLLALMPDTQQFADREKDARAIIENIRETKEFIHEIKQHFYKIQKHTQYYAKSLSKGLSKDPLDKDILRQYRKCKKEQDILYERVFESEESTKITDSDNMIAYLRDYSIKNPNITKRLESGIFCRCPVDS